jgi:hypothetical protein
MAAARRVKRRSIASVQLLDNPRQSRSRTVATTEWPQRTNLCALMPLCEPWFRLFAGCTPLRHSRFAMALRMPFRREAL